MKNNREYGITLVALVITIIILLILAGVAINAIEGSNIFFGKAKEASDKYNNASKVESELIENLMSNIDNYIYDKTPPKEFEISANNVLKSGFTISASTEDGEAPNGEIKRGIKEYVYYIKKENDSEYISEVVNKNEISKRYTGLEQGTKYNIYVEAVDNSENKTASQIINVTTLEDLNFTKEFLESGSIFGNVTYTTGTGNLNNSAGLRVVGTSTRLTGKPVDIKLFLRWYKSVDLTNYAKLTFYVKKVVNHGSVDVHIDDTQVYILSYANLPTKWTYVELDVSSYSGLHTLNLAGGYFDTSGNAASKTEICDIKLIAND